VAKSFAVPDVHRQQAIQFGELRRLSQFKEFAGHLSRTTFPVSPMKGCSALENSAWPKTQKRIRSFTASCRRQNNSFQRKPRTSSSNSASLETTATPSSSNRVSASRCGGRLPLAVADMDS